MQASNSASKALPITSSTTFSFVNSKLRNKHITASTNFQSVHPYTVMAMPLYASQNNLKDNVLSSMSSKKSSNRHSVGMEPSLMKVPKAMLKSN